MKSEIIRVLKKYRYPIVLSIIIMSTMMIVEMKHPYYFLQDDNRDYFLPIYVANLRAVIHGEIPLFNFHQFCGTPLLSSTQTAPFYPLNYGAIVLSKCILGNYFGAIDIIALFHLIIAGISFYYFMRYFGLHEHSCFWGALTWTFCGFVVSVGDSWIPIIGYAAYLPWISLLTIRFLKKVTVRKFILLVIVESLLFFLGWPQYFIYSVTFEIVHIILILFFTSRLFTKINVLESSNDIFNISPRIRKFLQYYFLQYICLIFIVLPVLLPGLHQISISNRNNSIAWETYISLSYNMKDWIYGLINPFSSTSHNYTWTNQNYISHIGYVTIVFLLIGVLYVRNKRYNLILVYFILGLLTLLFANNSIITKLFYLVPIYNKFRWPFKAAFFTSYSLIIVATFGFDYMYEKLQALKLMTKRLSFLVFACIIAMHIFNIIILYAYSSQKMFGVHLDNVPFDEPLRNILRSGRIVTLGPNYANYKVFPGLYGYTSPYLGFSYATFWELYHFGGYDPLLLERNAKTCLNTNYKSNLNIDANMSFEDQMKLVYYLRTWGVKWYIVDKQLSYHFFSNLLLRYSDNNRNVYYDSLARSFISWQNDSAYNDKVNFKFCTNYIEINSFNSSDDSLNVNVLFNEYFKAHIDGNAACLNETRDSQLELFVPKGSHSIIIEYSDPYFTYGVIGTGAFIVLVFLWALVYRKSFFLFR